MKGISLEPARSLLENLTISELSRVVGQSRPAFTAPRSRAELVNSITKHLSLDEIVEAIRLLFRSGRGRKAPTTAGNVRLDHLPPFHGDATVQIYSRSRPQLGQALLGRVVDCLTFGLNSTPLFLENRWTVMARDAGIVPRSRLYAAFIRPGRVHPSAQAPPPKTGPYILDEGEYQLRNGRLRFEFAHAGPISFQMTFLRQHPRSGRPEYLLEPIV